MKSMSLQATEAECAANAKAPRVTLDNMEAKIANRYFTTADDALGIVAVGPDASLSILTICFLVMKNGFVLIGKSAPASPENYNEELGRKLAYEDAIRQLWPMEGYALRDTLAVRAVDGGQVARAGEAPRPAA
jgi:hypothetical protein